MSRRTAMPSAIIAAQRLAGDAQVLARCSARTRVLELRRRGVSYEGIAALTHLSPAECKRRVADELKALAAATKEHRAEIRALECQRLDALLDGVWDSATSATDPQERAMAAAAALKVCERRAKLLGLDAPQEQRIKATVEKMSDAELEAVLIRAGWRRPGESEGGG